MSTQSGAGDKPPLHKMFEFNFVPATGSMEAGDSALKYAHGGPVSLPLPAPLRAGAWLHEKRWAGFAVGYLVLKLPERAGSECWQQRHAENVCT